MSYSAESKLISFSVSLSVYSRVSAAQKERESENECERGYVLVSKNQSLLDEPTNNMFLSKTA